MNPESDAAFAEIHTIARSHELQSKGWLSGNTAYLIMGAEPDTEIRKYFTSEA